jgi:hypothetical protein
MALKQQNFQCESSTTTTMSVTEVFLKVLIFDPIKEEVNKKHPAQVP